MIILVTDNWHFITLSSPVGSARFRNDFIEVIWGVRFQNYIERIGFSIPPSC